MAAALYLQDAVDDILGISCPANVIHPKDLLQRRPSFLNQGKIIKRKMRNEAPQCPLAKRWPNGMRGLAKRHNPLQRRGAFKLEIAVLVAEGKREGKSRFVQEVLMERMSASGFIGRIDRSTSER